MKVTQEKLPASQIGLEIEIPPEKSKQAYERVIQDFARAANIPGFRKGKVPRQILLQRLGPMRIKAAAVEELIKDSIEQALKQEAIAAIGQPQIKSEFEELVGKYDPGAALTFSLAVDVMPEVRLSQYNGLQVQAQEVKYDPARVEKVLEENRTEVATLIPVEGRSAQSGDVAVVDFQGHLVKPEGDESDTPMPEIPGGVATDFQLELLEGRFIEGFVDGIIGMNLGETKTIQVQFPEEYPQKDLAGHPASFTITLKELKEKELPELNDEFAQEVSEFETLSELRASLEAKFKEEAQNQTKANLHKALVDELKQHIEVELPETMIAQEIDNMLTQTAVQLSRQGIDVKKLFTQESIPQLRERSRPEAVQQLQQTLALQEVAKLESISVESAEIEARVKELRTEYKGKDIDLDRMREVVQEELLTEKILSWLEEHATVELVTAPEEAEEAEETVLTSQETEALGGTTEEVGEINEANTEETKETQRIEAVGEVNTEE